LRGDVDRPAFLACCSAHLTKCISSVPKSFHRQDYEDTFPAINNFGDCDNYYGLKSLAAKRRYAAAAVPALQS